MTPPQPPPGKLNTSIFPSYILLLTLFWYSLPIYADEALSIDKYFNQQEIEKTVTGKILTYAYLKGSDARGGPW